MVLEPQGSGRVGRRQAQQYKTEHGQEKVFPDVYLEGLFLVYNKFISAYNCVFFPILLWIKRSPDKEIEII
jgi:hypothetical protein